MSKHFEHKRQPGLLEHHTPQRCGAEHVPRNLSRPRLETRHLLPSILPSIRRGHIRAVVSAAVETGSSLRMHFTPRAPRVGRALVSRLRGRTARKRTRSARRPRLGRVERGEEGDRIAQDLLPGRFHSLGHLGEPRSGPCHHLSSHPCWRRQQQQQRGLYRRLGCHQDLRFQGQRE